MKKRVAFAPSLRGEVVVPGDKSISHRAAIFNAFATGSALVTNFLPGADCLSTLECLRQVGARIEVLASPDPSRSLTLRITGQPGPSEPANVLDAGNSGTTLRLLTGLLSGYPLYAVLTGDQSLRSRPMGRVMEPLRRMGALIDGRQAGTLAPLTIRGTRLRGAVHNLPVASAQVKSALLLAALRAEGETVIHQPAPSRDHSERLLAAMEAPVQTSGLTLALQGPCGLHATDVEVPGDISSAAFWMVAAAAHPRAELTLRNVGCNPTRAGIVEVLQAMGAEIRVENGRVVAGEPVADFTVRSSTLRGVEVAGDLIPRLIDEIPVLAVAAACAEGVTVVRDARELRVKESDRIAAVAEGLRRFGVTIHEREDGFAVEGPTELNGAALDSGGDHRLAMAFAVAGLLARGETMIEGAEAASVSYPGFWEDLERITARA